jgi:hypothetical protein
LKEQFLLNQLIRRGDLLAFADYIVIIADITGEISRILEEFE